jgi:hypothetical protein
VTGASNPYLADPEKSKKGEGVKDSAKVVVSCIHIDIQSGDGFMASQAALLSNMSITFMTSDVPPSSLTILREQGTVDPGRNIRKPGDPEHPEKMDKSGKEKPSNVNR